MSQGPLNEYGRDATGVSQLTGGRGVRGWLSSIFATVAKYFCSTPDSGNSATRTSANGATQFVGSWYDTRSAYDSTKRVIAAQQVVLSSTVSSGLGGTLVFEYSDDAVTATISESRTITDFSTVRDLTLQNAGNYFRVKFTPSRALTGVEMVFITVSEWFITPPAFVRLANQQTEIANMAAGNVFSYIKGFGPDGKSRNVGVTNDDRLEVDSGIDLTMFGAQNVESMFDNISVTFNSDAEMNIETVTLAANGGSEATSSNNLVCSTGTGTTGQAGRFSKSNLIYDPGHEGRAQLTTVMTATTAGCSQQAGLFTDDFNNGAYIEDDGTAFFIVHKRGGSVVTKLSSANWNGNTDTDYTLNGVVIPIDTTTGRVWRIRFGYLGYAGIIYQVRSPDGVWCTIHTIKYESETVPLFSRTDLHVAVRAIKTSGASNVQIKSASWNAGSFGQKHDPVKSFANSSTTALTAGATFTGDWVIHEGFNSLELIVVTDQVSAGNGIMFEFSERGDAAATVRTTRFDTFSASDVTLGFKRIVIPPDLSYTRIVYQNGGTPQGSFFMQLRLHDQPLEIPRGGIEADISSANTALMMRGLNVGKNTSGTYNNVTVTQTDSSGRVGLHVGIMKHDVGTPILALTSWATNQATIASTTTAVNVVPSPTSGRKTVAIKSLSSNTKTVFIGPSSAVTTGSGWELAAGESIAIEVDQTAAVWVIGSTATSQTLCYAEVAGTP